MCGLSDRFPEGLPEAGLPLRFAGELLNGVDVLLYLGGVTYSEPGVGGLELGFNPRSFR